MIHTFSPNWYKPQCLCFSNNNLFYASNYVLYKYNLPQRKIENERCFRKVAISCGFNSKDIKIHTIKVINNWIIAGMNQPHAVVLDFQKLEVLGVVRDIGVENSFLCEVGYQNKQEKDLNKQQKSVFAIFASDSGAFSKVLFDSPQDYTISSTLSQNFPKQKVKQIITFDKFSMIIFNKGIFLFLDKNYTKVIQKVEPSTIGLDNQHILSVDTLQQNENIFVSVLSRAKNNSLFLHVCVLKFNQNQMHQTKIEYKKMLKTQIKILYPKAMDIKLQNAQRAALTIKFINQSSILMTGKLGQIFIINWNKCQQVILIKPHSLDDIPQCLQILDDSKHYKQIYAVYKHKRLSSKNFQLYTISTDQTMNIWTINNNTVTSLFSIKFVTAELFSIFYSDADPKTVFFLLKDSIIRSTLPLGGQNYFLAQHWKHTKKFKIVKAVAHLSEPGVTAMLTTQNKILIYDLYDDRLIKIIDFHKGQQQIINISYEFKTIMEPVQRLVNVVNNDAEHQWVKQQVKINKMYSKPILNQQKVGLFVQMKTKLWYFSIKNDDIDDVFSIKKVCRIERVHNTKLFDGNTLLFSQYKNNNLKIWLWDKGIKKIQTNIKLGGRCVFKIEQQVLWVIETKAKKICVYGLDLNKNLQVNTQLQVDLPIFAEQIVVDYLKRQAAIYNSKDDMLLILEFNQKAYSLCNYQIGNKIESLSFYLNGYLIIGFKDQSIKAIKIDDLMISNMSMPNKKVKKSPDFKAVVKELKMEETYKIEEQNV